MTALPEPSASSATSKSAKPSTGTAAAARIEMPLGYDGGVPDNANTERVSVVVRFVALRLVGSPQALSTTTTDIAARMAGRAFMQIIDRRESGGVASR